MAKQTATTKRKPVPKRKPIAKRKPMPKRKPAGKPIDISAAAPELANRAQQTSRNVYLAGLGFYGIAYDQAQETIDVLQTRLSTSRKQADKLYHELVKRGQQVEKDARKAFKEIDLSALELDSAANRKKIEAKLKKARLRFAELKDSVGLSPAI